MTILCSYCSKAGTDTCLSCNNHPVLSAPGIHKAPTSQTKGWECPKCEGVNAPHVPICWHCKSSSIKPAMTTMKCKGRSIHDITNRLRFEQDDEYTTPPWLVPLMMEAADEIDRLRTAIELVRGIIIQGALEGFNPLEGDWADRLYKSQAVTRAALKPKPSNKPTGEQE